LINDSGEGYFGACDFECLTRVLINQSHSSEVLGISTFMLPILPHLLRPFKGGAPSLIVIFAIGLSLAAQAGFAGLWLGLILSSWYWKYAFILFDSTIQGVEEPPALDIQMVNPVDEQRPLAQLCILAAMYWICHAAAVNFGAPAGVALGVVFGLSLPASVAVLGTEGHVLRAMNPAVLFNVAVSLGWRYTVFIGVFLAYVLLAFGVFALDLWLPLNLLVILFLGLSLFSLLAGFLYDRRDELGLEVWHSPEKKQARREADVRMQSQKVVDDAYGQVRAAQHVAAWNTLTAWLETRQHRFEDYDWLIERITPWPDGRYLTRVTEDYLDRLLAANRNKDALVVADRALRHEPAFRPKTPASTLKLAHLALSNGAPMLARSLIADYGQRFPSDPNVRAAQSLLTRLNAL
jgi:hypothetical protein